jgi:purine nucleosidase
VRVILDTDAGVDDAVAIAFAAASSELEVVALTTVAGNAPVDLCTRNVLLLSELLWPRVPPPVAAGAARPLDRPLETAPEVHGEDGLGGGRGSLPEPGLAPDPRAAHRLILEEARAGPGETVLVATGPLTNLALALAEDEPGFRALRAIVVMGGAFAAPGNTGPVAEFNFYVDPVAADRVLAAGLPLTLVPLDVTTRAPLLRSDVPALASPPPAGASGDLRGILSRALDFYMSYQRTESGLDGGYMHDPMAVAAAIDPAIIRSRPEPVGVVADGPDRGRSITAEDGRAPVAVAREVEAASFLDLLRRRVVARLLGA